MTFWIFRKEELAKTLKEEKLPAWLAVMEKLLAAQVTEKHDLGCFCVSVLTVTF